MRPGRLLMLMWVVWGGVLFQAGCSGCEDPHVTYGLPGIPSGSCPECGGSPGPSPTPSPTPAPSPGPACASSAECPSSAVCLEGTCSACTDSAQCASGSECRAGSCVQDSFAPRVETAFLPGSTVLRVHFSEPMLQDDSATGVLNPDNYCVEVTDETPGECSPSDAFWMGSVLTSVDPSTVDVQLPFAPGGGRYTVHVSGVVDRAGNALGSLRHADFEVGGPLRLVSATSAGPHGVVLTFSRPVPPGPDASGSAGCGSPSTCASRYRLVGPTSLGTIVSAQVLPAPRDNEVLLTHSAAQGGGQYTVLVTSGTDSQAMSSVSGEHLGTSPLDRVTFTGAGSPVLSFSDGPVQVDPFADGVAAASVTPYQGRAYLGPNANGMRGVGLAVDGLLPEDLSFRFRKDTQKLSGSRSSNTSGAPFPSLGFAGCQANTYECGPDNEDGRVSLASGTLDGTEWLMMGGTRSGGGLGYVYLSRDDDAVLDLKYVDLGQALDAASARSFSALGFLGGRAYLAVPVSGGTRRPELLALLHAPALDAEGLEARGNGAHGGACKPSSQDVCNLAAHRMPGIGASGSPANPASTVGIDFVAEFNGKLYLGNNGGLVRATVAQPLDYESAPQHWVSITPSAGEYGATESLTTDKTADLEPADRTWSRMAVFHGHVYLGRNTTSGPQLWRCDPERISGPAPASAQDCDAGDWVLIAGNGAGDSRLSQFDNANNTRLTLLAVNGNHLYVGFDNAVEGVTVFRSTGDVPERRSDFTPWGGNGFGEPSLNTRFGEATSMGTADHGFLQVTVHGGPGVPTRLYRQWD